MEQEDVNNFYALSLIKDIKYKNNIDGAITQLVFGYHSIIESTNSFNEIETNYQFNLKKIKTFTLLKNAIWACTLDDEAVPIQKRKVNVLMLTNLMKEIDMFINFIQLSIHYENRLALRRSA